MNRTTVAALGVVVGVLVWLATRRDVVQSVGSGLQNAYDSGVDYMGQLGETFGFVKTSNMSAVDKSLVNHPNVRAMFRVIRQGESSQDDGIAYRMIVGRSGVAFTSFADHPRIFGTKTSTAAGAYQITKTTWDWVRKAMGLNDFSPASQDLAALGLLAYLGALPAVLAGNVEAAIPKMRSTWTSLPGARENNEAAGDIEKAKRLFVAWGGSGSVYA